MVTVLYRGATLADAPALAAFAARTFVETFGRLYPPEDLAAYLAKSYGAEIQARELADPAVIYRLALREEHIVGYAMAGPMDMAVAHASHDRELHRLYVASALKGAGVAQELMRQVLAWTRAQGAEALFLSVWENNHRAQAFYRRYGFAEVGRHDFMVGRVADRDLIWRLEL